MMNDNVFAHFGVKADSAEWNDWRWQYSHHITTVETLSKIIHLGEQEQREIETTLGRFRMAITPYFASLMDPDNPLCPIRMQAVPSIKETRVRQWEAKDPLGEERESPVPFIVHRYPDRVLFLVTGRCAMYCRHCTRKRHVSAAGARLAGEERQITKDEIEKAIDYIARTQAVRDVLVSGGDPLTMETADLEYILARLRSIGHVEIIRIGTRAPVTLPMRITTELLSMLKKYHPLWMNVHFNHPRELTPLSEKACADIADAGIPLGSQTVLLRNINDNPETMKDLMLKLLKARVRPYYIYQCDLCEGSEHFRTRVETGIDILKKLTGNITGLAIPRFVIDTPDGGGKVPLNPDFVVSMNDDRIELRNREGRVYTYPQPEKQDGADITSSP